MESGNSNVTVLEHSQDAPRPPCPILCLASVVRDDAHKRETPRNLLR